MGVCLPCGDEDGIRDLVRSRGLGDVYKRQISVSLSQNEVTSVQDTFSTGLFAPLKWLGLSLVTFCHWACVTGCFPSQ